MAKIAVSCKGQERKAGIASGPPRQRQLASGDGWSVSDIVCTSGPQDPPFDEQFSEFCVAIVLQGTFQYQTSAGREFMVPGSFLLGNAGDCFTCGHEHGTGDRCLSFSYSPQFYEAFTAGRGLIRSRFRAPRLAPMRGLSPLVSRASELLEGSDAASFEELGIQVLGQVTKLEPGLFRGSSDAEPSSLARVTRVVRMIDSDPAVPQDLASLAQVARLSPYHFIRVFESLTGTTPHQYCLRIRLRRVALRLRKEPAKILDIALECGFDDVSNFNRTFRAEFGVSPRAYRSRT